MAAVTIRNLSEETHRALKQRAAEHGRSTEAEIRSILEEAVRQDENFKLGTYLAERVREFGGVELDIQRDRSPIRPAIFE